MEKYKKWQFPLAIILGIISGAGVALLVGNKLSGVFSAFIVGITAWFGSLKWSELKEKAQELAGKMDVEKSLEMAISVGKVVIARPLKRIFYEIPKEMKRDVVLRKLFCYGAVVVLLNATAIYSFFLIPKNLPEPLRSPFFLCSLVVWVMAGIFALCFSAGNFVIMLNCILFCDDIDEYKNFPTPMSKFDYFLFGWMLDGFNDNRGAFASTVYMLKVRTGNILRFPAFICMLVLWIPQVLAGEKSGVVTMTAMALFLSHWGVSYYNSWINVFSLNFWLSLVVTLIIGGFAGLKIHSLTDFKVPDFPKFQPLVYKALPAN